MRSIKVKPPTSEQAYPARKHVVGIAAVCLLSNLLCVESTGQDYPFTFTDASGGYSQADGKNWFSSTSSWVFSEPPSATGGQQYGAGGALLGASRPVSGVASIIPSTGMTSITLSRPIPAAAWQYTDSQSITIGTYPLIHTYNTSLTVSFSLAASTLSVSSGPVTPSQVYGDMFNASFGWTPVEIPLSWSYSLVQDSVEIGSGSGVVKLACRGVIISQQLGGYPDTLGISVFDMHFEPEQSSIFSVSPPNADGKTVRAPSLYTTYSGLDTFAAAVPEPQHYAIMTGTGLLSLCLARKRGWFDSKALK